MCFNFWWADIVKSLIHCYLLETMLNITHIIRWIVNVALTIFSQPFIMRKFQMYRKSARIVKEHAHVSNLDPCKHLPQNAHLFLCFSWAIWELTVDVIDTTRLPNTRSMLKFPSCPQTMSFTTFPVFSFSFFWSSHCL